MLKANKNFVEIKLQEAKPTGGFVVAEGNVGLGVVVSVGEDITHIKKKDIVLFDQNKALQFPVKGENHYFVKVETILAYESNK